MLIAREIKDKNKAELGIVRNLDDLGRVVIPKEFRKSLELEDNKPVNIYVKDGVVCIAKVPEKKCVFCGNTNELDTVLGKHWCKRCESIVFGQLFPFSAEEEK